jgi:hypothetical protein
MGAAMRAVCDLHAGLSAGGFGAAPFCRGAFRTATGCIEQTGLDGAARTRLVPTACAEQSRSRRSPLAGCGRSGRRSTPLASGGTAAATTSGARSVMLRLAARCRASTLPWRVSSPAAALPAAAHPSRCPAFDLLLHRPARPTAVTTVVGAKVAGVLSAGCRSILDVLVFFSLLPALLAGRWRRRGVAMRRIRQLWLRSSAAATIGVLGRAARASPAARMAPRGSPTALPCLSPSAAKCCGVPRVRTPVQQCTWRSYVLLFDYSIPLEQL